MAIQAYKNTAYTLGQSPLTDMAPVPVKAKRAPLGTDTGYSLGQEWVFVSANRIWFLSSVVSGIANWIELLSGASAIETINNISPNVAGNFTFTAGSGITLTPGVNSITIASAGGGITTINGDSGSVTGATVTFLASNSGVNGTSRFSGSGTTMIQTFTGGGGGNNLGLGANALVGNTTGGIGSNNIALGDNTLPSLTAANSNIAIGSNAQFSNVGEGSNIAIGSNALSANNSTAGNIAIGGNALITLNGGSANNVAIGNNILGAATSLAGTVAIGNTVLSSLLTGTNNTALGYNAGSSYTAAESNNILIGFDTLGTAGESNALHIGSGTGTGAGNLNKSFISGVRGITTINNDAIAVLIDSAGQLGTVSSSIRFKENIKDMKNSSNNILDLRPVTFNYKEAIVKDIHFGLIAEEVAEAFPQLAVNDKDGIPLTVKYHELPILLLNELQKALKRIEKLESKK